MRNGTIVSVLYGDVSAIHMQRANAYAAALDT